MRTLEKILPSAAYKSIYKRFSNLKRFAPLDFRVGKYDLVKRYVAIEVWQTERRTDDIYSVKELVEFTRSFADIIEDQGFTVHIAAKEYAIDGIDNVSAVWVKDRLIKHGISQNQLARDLSVNKFMISRLMNNRTGFTSWSRAAVWYYFKNLEEYSSQKK